MQPKHIIMAVQALRDRKYHKLYQTLHASCPGFVMSEAKFMDVVKEEDETIDALLAKLIE